jgi:hypothetical protein
MSLWTLCVIVGAALQYAFAHHFGRGLWRKLLVPALVALGAMIASSGDCAFACLCMLVGTFFGACIYWISLSFEL